MDLKQTINSIGIDLGTTRSAVATISASGQTVMLANELGEVLTPSVVQFSDDEIVVGREACKALSYDASGVADCVKRDMGKPLYRRPILGKAMPPEVIAACLLKYLKHLLETQLAGEHRVAITVPAFFDERRRKATVDAGRMAGLEVLDIINEPTAAALAFGEHLGYLTETGAARETQRVLVFDLGGGTFDSTVIELSPDGFVTLATDGDVHLGGTDWDARLAQYVAQKFEAEHCLDPRDDELAMAKILQTVEDAKQALSARHQATIMAEYEGHTSQIVVTREQFEALTADLLERTAHTTEEVLRESGLSWSQIDRLLLVGGSTRMPMVSRRLYELSGKAADQSVNPDEAVARGAAIYAAYRMAAEGPSPLALRFQIVDVNSHSLGIEGIDVATSRKENIIIIPRNTPLPTQAMHQFVTKEADQKSIVLRVLEGETIDPEDCITIGRAVLRDLPEGLLEGHPLEVTFAYAVNGRLTVQMTVPGTQRELTMELQRGEMLTDEHVEDWARLITLGEGFRSFEEMLTTVLGINIEPHS